MSYVLTFLNWIFIAFLVLAMFNILIVVHELGHFLAARWRGLVVEKFAIWFGKPLWKKEIGGVEYILGSIPAGGYVALPQMAPMETVEGKNETPRELLPEAKPVDKIIVALAGPVFSFLLALVFACLVWAAGKPVSAIDNSQMVGWVKPGSGAAEAGLRAGDHILEVDGAKVNRFTGIGHSITWQIIRSEGATIPFVIERDGKTETLQVTPKIEEKSFWQRGGLRQVGITPGLEILRVKEVLPGSPAERAGLLPGDRITRLNGERIYYMAPIWNAEKEHPDRPLTLTVEREGTTFEATFTPEVPVSPPGLDKALDGIVWDPIMTLTYPNPWQQVVDSVTAIVDTLGALFSVNSNVNASHLSGPIGIMNLYAQLFQSPDGWRLVLWLSVLINVNLAIFNLLPLPVLDGGHITLAILEIIRRKPLSMRVLEPIQTGFALLLLGFMAYVTLFDIQDVSLPFSGGGGKIEFAAPGSQQPGGGS